MCSSGVRLRPLGSRPGLAASYVRYVSWLVAGMNSAISSNCPAPHPNLYEHQRVVVIGTHTCLPRLIDRHLDEGSERARVCALVSCKHPRASSKRPRQPARDSMFVWASVFVGLRDSHDTTRHDTPTRDIAIAGSCHVIRLPWPGRIEFSACVGTDRAGSASANQKDAVEYVCMRA